MSNLLDRCKEIYGEEFSSGNLVDVKFALKQGDDVSPEKVLDEISAAKKMFSANISERHLDLNTPISIDLPDLS